MSLCGFGVICSSPGLACGGGPGWLVSWFSSLLYGGWFLVRGAVCGSGFLGFLRVGGVCFSMIVDGFWFYWWLDLS